MRRLLGYYLILLFLVPLSTLARADPMPPPQVIRFDRFRGFLELGALYRDEDRERQGSAAFDIQQLDIDQLLFVETVGSVYHPRFLEFQSSFGLNMKQEVIDNGQGTRFPVEADLRFDFLKQHAYGLTTFGKISQSELERPFARTVRFVDATYGASLHYRPDPVSLDLVYRRRLRESSARATNLDEKGDDFIASGRYRASKNSQGDFEFGYTDEVVQNRDIQRITARFSNVTFLDEKKRIRSSTRGRLRNQMDAGETFTATLSTNLDWRHSDHLRTRYFADYRRNRIDRPATRAETIDSYNVGASIDHRLYKSLDSLLDFAVNVQEGTSESTRRYAVTLTENYTKRLGSWGRLRLNLRPGIDFQERRTNNDTGTAIDEIIALVGVLPVTLAQLDIEAGTVVVTDTSGAFVFIEGLDYEITPRGRSTEIRRLIGGNLTDGQSVLVDYSYQLGGSGDILTRRTGAFAEVSVWEMAAVYGRFEETNQNRTAGNLDLRLEALQRAVVGGRIDLSWASSSVEYETQRSTFNSFDSLSESLAIFTPTSNGWRARVSAKHSNIEYTDSNEQVRRITARASFAMPVGRRGRIELESDFQQERWSGGTLSTSNDLDAIGAAVEFTWRIRRVQLALAARIRRIDTRGEIDMRQRVDLRLRREF